MERVRCHVGWAYLNSAIHGFDGKTSFLVKLIEFRQPRFQQPVQAIIPVVGGGYKAGLVWGGEVDTMIKRIFEELFKMLGMTGGGVV